VIFDVLYLSPRSDCTPCVPSLRIFLGLFCQRDPIFEGAYYSQAPHINRAVTEDTAMPTAHTSDRELHPLSARRVRFSIHMYVSVHANSHLLTYRHAHTQHTHTDPSVRTCAAA